MEGSYSTGLLLSVEVRLNLTLGVFHVVLEKMCHIEEKIKYRVWDLFCRCTGDKTYGSSYSQNFIITEVFFIHVL